MERGEQDYVRVEMGEQVHVHVELGEQVCVQVELGEQVRVRVEVGEQECVQGRRSAGGTGVLWKAGVGQEKQKWSKRKSDAATEQLPVAHEQKLSRWELIRIELESILIAGEF